MPDAQRKVRKVKEAEVRIGGILKKRDLARIGIMGIPARPGVASAIFTALGDKGINCPFIAHTIDLDNQDNIVLCVVQSQLAASLEALEKISHDTGTLKVVHSRGVAVVSVYGPHFGERPGVAGVMFTALAGANINIQAISTSISTLSCIINATQLDDAVEILLEAFQHPGSGGVR